MERKFKDYIRENRWSNDPTRVYNDLGDLAEDVKNYYFTAMDNLDRLKLAYGEDENNLQEYVDKIKENVDKIKDAYMNIENYNKKDWSVVNKPWK